MVKFENFRQNRRENKKPFTTLYNSLQLFTTLYCSNKIQNILPINVRGFTALNVPFYPYFETFWCLKYP
jgi:hypothetical protein